MASESFSPLLELPDELLEMVAEETDWHGFTSLRLTSRGIAERLASLLARRCCWHLHYMMMDRQSLQTLEQVTAHPIFGKSIKVLTLNVAKVVGESEDEKQVRREIWEEEHLRMQLGATSASDVARSTLLVTMPHVPATERELRVMERTHKVKLYFVVAEQEVSNPTDRISIYRANCDARLELSKLPTYESSRMNIQTKLLREVKSVQLVIKSVENRPTSQAVSRLDYLSAGQYS